MLRVNERLYQPQNLYNFIDDSVNRIIYNSQGINSRKEYWLYYFIREDFRGNLWSLYNVDIDTDFFGFPLIRKNTRHAIEAFVDLHNLCSNQEYIEVLKYCAGIESNIEQYRKYLYKRQFTIQSKVEIAEEKDGKDFSHLLKISKECNAFIHPNVFVNILSTNERAEKEKILKDLLKTNVYLLKEAYELLVKQFNQGIQPYIGCSNCFIKQQCLGCYKNFCDTFINCIDTSLLIECNPFVYSFNNRY